MTARSSSRLISPSFLSKGLSGRLGVSAGSPHVESRSIRIGGGFEDHRAHRSMRPDVGRRCRSSPSRGSRPFASDRPRRFVARAADRTTPLSAPVAWMIGWSDLDALPPKHRGHSSMRVGRVPYRRRNLAKGGSSGRPNTLGTEQRMGLLLDADPLGTRHPLSLRVGFRAQDLSFCLMTRSSALRTEARPIASQRHERRLAVKTRR